MKHSSSQSDIDDATYLKNHFLGFSRQGWSPSVPWTPKPKSEVSTDGNVLIYFTHDHSPNPNPKTFNLKDAHTLSLCHSLSLSPPVPHTHNHTHTHTPTLSISLTHSHTHTHTPHSLSHSLTLSLSHPPRYMILRSCMVELMDRGIIVPKIPIPSLCPSDAPETLPPGKVFYLWFSYVFFFSIFFWSLITLWYLV